MPDDIDRQCCGHVERLIKEAVGQSEAWVLKKRAFLDPGMVLVLEHTSRFGLDHPKVTVTIGYGELIPRGTQSVRDYG